MLFQVTDLIIITTTKNRLKMYVYNNSVIDQVVRPMTTLPPLKQVKLEIKGQLV